MSFKAGFAIGFGAGYVLGSRAGRERYEDIKRMWGRVMGSPTVHRATERTKAAAEEGARKGLHVVQHGVEKAGTAVRERLHRPSSGSTDEQTETIVDLVEEQEGRGPEEGPTTAGEAFAVRPE